MTDRRRQLHTGPMLDPDLWGVDKRLVQGPIFRIMRGELGRNITQEDLQQSMQQALVQQQEFLADAAGPPSPEASVGMPTPTRTLPQMPQTAESPSPQQQADFAMDFARRHTGKDYQNLQEVIDDIGVLGAMGIAPKAFGEHTMRGFGMLGDLLTGTGGGAPENVDPHFPTNPFAEGQPQFPPTLGQTVGGLGGGGGVQGQDPMNQAFSMQAPLPPTGEEVFGGIPEMPTISRDVMDTMMSRLSELEPAEHERRGIRPQELVSGMGQGLISMGDAPTMAEALLGAGTGASGVMAEHEMRQDAMQHEAEEARRQHQIQMAQTEFEGEQLLNEQERALWQSNIELLTMAAEQDANRLNEVLRRTDVELGSDGEILVREPGTDADGNDTINVSVMRPNEIDATLDGWAQRITSGDMDFGEFAGEDLNQFLVGASPERAFDLITVSDLILMGGGDQIPTQEGQQLMDWLRQQAVDRVDEKAPGDIRSTDREDYIQRELFRLIHNQMNAQPGFRYQLYATSRNDQLRQFGWNMFEQLPDDAVINPRPQLPETNLGPAPSQTEGQAEGVRSPGQSGGMR